MTAGRGSSEDRWDLLGIVLLGVAYYVAARLSLQLALVEENITPLWPPTGIALAGFLLRGRGLWQGVAIAAFAVNLPISETPLAAATTAAGNTLAPLLAATLLARVGFRPELDRLRDALAIVFLGALLSMTVSATVGAGTLVATDAIPPSEFPAAWTVWWAGDAMGILVVAPFLLTLPTFRERSFQLGRRGLEALVLLVVVAASAYVAVTSEGSWLFVVLPITGFTAWRLQQRGAAPAALVVSLIATWAAVEARGPFDGLDLLERMVTLQAFNAAVAFTSFCFAAMVSERMRARLALEEAAVRLEERVRTRTAELSAANDRLEEAQELANLGFWEWDVESGEVSWSPELYRIYGVPEGDRITFERAVELVVPEDRAQIRANVARAIDGRSSQLPDVEYRVQLEDGTLRSLLGRARTTLSDDGTVVRMMGTVQDVSERREHEREHRIAETLQRALLPQRLPEISGLGFATRYLPAEEGSSAGGDWYDVIELPDGTVALVIGDVAGHGADAASVMGQVRMAVRAFGLEGHGPKKVVGLVHDLLRSLYEGDQMVTMLYLVVDPVTLEARVVNAGHPPPLVLEPASGSATFLEVPIGLPLGLTWDLPYEESLARLQAGATLVLFTDGLIDRRDVPVTEGLVRLRSTAVRGSGLDLDDLCGMLLEELVPSDASDDVAILAARLVPARERFHVRVPADPVRLRSIRRRVARWLSGVDVEPLEVDDIVLACSEACSNAIEHAYGPEGGSLEVELEAGPTDIVLVVRDEGRWRPTRDGDRGRGLKLMETCMDSVEVTRSETGTEVLMRRAIRREVPA